MYAKELTFWKKLTELETTVASREGLIRGYYTYTELSNLAATIEIYNLFQCIAAVSLILAATYTAGFLTIVGSMFLTSYVPGTSLYAIKYDKLESNNTNSILSNLEPCHGIVKTDVNSKCSRSLGVADLLKTSILLASIKTNETEQKITGNAQYISWDYWNVPAMQWFAESCQYLKNYIAELTFQYYPYYLETSASNMKCIELEDQIHKATKTRIQDQMESSWHEEWTDMYNKLYFGKMFLLNVKS